MRVVKSLVLVVLAVAALMGCRRGIQEGPYAALSVPQAAREEREKIVVLDGILSGKVAFENHAVQRDADDRLKVFVNIRNRTQFPQAVDMQTVYKNEQGVSLDETAWKRMSLGPNETQSYQSISLDGRPVNYTVRVRQGQ